MSCIEEVIPGWLFLVENTASGVAWVSAATRRLTLQNYSSVGKAVERMWRAASSIVMVSDASHGRYNAVRHDCDFQFIGHFPKIGDQMSWKISEIFILLLL